MDTHPSQQHIASNHPDAAPGCAVPAPVPGKSTRATGGHHHGR